MKTIVYILMLVAGLSSIKADACSCIEKPSTLTALTQSDIVIVGTVLSEEYLSTDTSAKKEENKIYRHIRRYKILIADRYKGSIANDTAYVYTGEGGGDCGRSFAIGQRYIVYGNRLQGGSRNYSYGTEENALWTGICDRTMLFDPEEVDAIKRILPKKTPKGR